MSFNSQLAQMKRRVKLTDHVYLSEIFHNLTAISQSCGSLASETMFSEARKIFDSVPQLLMS